VPAQENLKPTRHPQLQKNKLRLIADRSVALAEFLKAIRSKTPHVLNGLHECVFPSFLTGIQKNNNAINNSERDDDSIECWSSEYNDAWLATWDWAERANLTRGMNLEFLRSNTGPSLAKWHSEWPSWHSKQPRKPPARLNTPFRVARSPEITFAMPLVKTVWDTLVSWANLEPDPSNLDWAYPKSLGPIHEELSIDQFQRLMSNSLVKSAISSKLGPPPYTYAFTTFARDFRHETQNEAKTRILADLAKQVDEHLDEHAHSAANKPYLEKHTDKRVTDHFKCLVMYQVNDLNYAEVTEVLHPNSRISGLPRTDAELVKHKLFRTRKAGVTTRIKDAAESLIGPRFKQWLGSPLRGAPKKHRQG
jgi:hypothetical protein